MLIDWDIPFNIGIRVLLNSYCNYNCFFCHNEGELKAKKDIIFTPKEFKKILLTFKRLGSHSVAFSGGEPLLFPLFKEYLEIVVKIFQANNIYITTNGSLIDKHIEFLKKNKIKKIYISLHSLSPLNYKALTSVNNLSKIKKNIKLLLKNNIRVVINMIMLKGINFKTKELEKMFNFCEKNNIRLNLLRVFNRRGRGKYYVNCKEIRNKMKQLGFKEIIPVKLDIFPFTRFQRRNLEVHLRDFSPVPIDSKLCLKCPYRVDCSEGYYYPRITTRGFLKPCLWRNDLSLDLKKSLKDDTLLIDIKRFFKNFNRKDQPWKRVDN
ncbi:MAG TPA: radical SAM protein [Candidatus Bathyarchaeia archaeon]|nr:radical SAM protein [Candidatus Bathyarchaeia archaeon]